MSCGCNFAMDYSLVGLLVVFCAAHRCYRIILVYSGSFLFMGYCERFCHRVGEVWLRDVPGVLVSYVVRVLFGLPPCAGYFR